MSSKLATMRFPDGTTQYESSSERTPVVGDVIRTNGDAWRIAEVWENDDGALIVRLEAHTDSSKQAAGSPRGNELLELAAQVRADSEQLRADAAERRLRRQERLARKDGRVSEADEG